MTNTTDYTTIENLDATEIGKMIIGFIGKTTIATLDVDDDGNKVKETFELPLATFPIIALEKFLAYGMQRVFNDHVGGADKYSSTDEKLDAVKDMIAEYKNGIVKKARAVGVVITDVAKLARVTAKKALKAQYIKQDRESDYKDTFLAFTTSEQNQLLDSIVEANPAMLVTAQAEIDARDSVVVDLTDLLLDESEDKTS